MQKNIFEISMFWNEKTIFFEKVFNTLEYAQRFYLAEGNESHSGKIKRPFQLPELLGQLPENLRSRVVFVPVDLSAVTEKNPFAREKLVRDAALTALKKDPEFSAESIVLIQDFDEFISPKKISLLEQMLFSWKFWVKAIRLRQHLSIYKLNLMDQNDWGLSLACAGSLVKKNDFSANEWRHHFGKKKAGITREFFGWHHSYLGDTEFIRNKIDSFAEANLEMVKTVTDEQIEKALSTGLDLYGRSIHLQPVEYQNLDPIPILQKRTDLMVTL